MKLNTKIRIVFVGLLLIWATVIFVMSSQPAHESSKISGGFVSRIINVFYSDFENLSNQRQTAIADSLSFFIRKTAHFLEYFILGALSITTALTFEMNKFNFKLFGAVLFSVLYAVSDEVHQYFVPGRACRFLDICIDSAGSICGIALIVLAVWLKKRYKSGELNA